MKNHMLAVLIGLLLPALCVAQSTELFHENGMPTPEFKQSIAAQGAPELLSGVDLVAAHKRADGEWDLLDEDACIVMRFHVNPEGKLDRYVVLDSQPEKMLERATMMAIANWQFAKSAKGAWVVLPFKVSVFPAENSMASDTRLKKASKAANFLSEGRVNCYTPTVSTKVMLPSPLALEEQHIEPLVPRDVVRAAQAGCATLTFNIQPDGSTADFEMLDAKPGDAFVTASAVAVSAWKFQAAQRAEPRRGFVRFDFGIQGIKPVQPTSCMEPQFAATHYQPTKEAP
ncbi:MAG: TonB family protein [Pseudomonadota bacterium]